VHHDAALLGAVVDPFVQSLEPKRVSLAPLVGALREEEAEARLAAVVDVGEVGGEEVTLPWARSSTQSRGWVDGRE
jgi:hypothetical protein